MVRTLPLYIGIQYMPEGGKVYGSELTRRCYGNEQLDTWFKIYH